MMQAEWIRCCPTLVLVAVLALVAPLNAQDDLPSANDLPSADDLASARQQVLRFDETINVRVIDLDVWVTDRKTGEPITGLMVDDFELFEDKRPIKISNFYEYVSGEAVGGAPEAERPGARPKRDPLLTSHPGLRASSIPEDQRLSLVVYVDEFNITPNHRNRVFRFVRQFLRTKLDRDDRVMLINYNRSVKVIMPFTSDAQLVADATYELEKHTGGRTSVDSERYDLLKEIDENPQNSYMTLVSRTKLHAESLFNDLQFTLDGLELAVTQLAGIPGRKALLYISDGLPLRAGEDLFWALDEKFHYEPGLGQSAGNLPMEAFMYDASRRYQEIATLANANRVTFYTIDAAGLRVGGMRSAEFAHMSFTSNIDSIHIRNLQDSIVFLAARTGGQSIINTNNILGGLGKIGNDFDNRYSLGFSPSRPPTGRSYGLEVKLKGKGGRRVRIRHRETYSDKPVEQEMGEAVLASLAYGYQTNPLRIEVEPARGADWQILREDGSSLVTLAVRIPIAELVLVPIGDHHEASVTLYVQVIDKKGKISAVRQQIVPVVVQAGELETARQGYWNYELKLLMESGEQRVAVGVLDGLSARRSMLIRIIDVG